MAAAFGAPALGTALVVISGFYGPPGQETRGAFFPQYRNIEVTTKTAPSDTAGKLSESISRLRRYRSLPAVSQAPAPQRLRRSDLCARAPFFCPTFFC